MRPKTITVAPSALDRDGIAQPQYGGTGEFLLNGALSAGFDRDGICQAQTPAAAGAMTINGALAQGGVVVLPVPRRLLVYASGDNRGISFVINGTDVYGRAFSETITGPNTTYSWTGGFFKTVTSVYATGAGTGNIEVGTQGVGTFDIPRHVGVYCASDMSGATLTVYGTDRYGTEVSEVIAGPNATTVSGSINFKEITKIGASGIGGANIEIGSYSSFETQVIPLDAHSDAHSLQLILSSTKNFTIDVQATADDIKSKYESGQEAAIDFTETEALQNVTADTTSTAYGPLSGVRCQVTSFLAGSFEFTAASR